ncbi:hypothetical protein OS187_11655 [Xanthomonadaceae bacterium JHOS43]|jgi:hypothetical protein|nr:hypothetical protein [Xanthomonadaceae bacterium JHOS43]MCX7561939.1 hypothetical protein [Xanthomonadaceae bacterium XH05]
MQYLSVILFFPWFVVVGAWFMLFPRQPGGALRRLFELTALVVAVLLSIRAMLWGIENADPTAGAIWKQVLATLLAYGMFLGVLLLAWPVRNQLLRRK